MNRMQQQEVVQALSAEVFRYYGLTTSNPFLVTLLSARVEDQPELAIRIRGNASPTLRSAALQLLALRGPWVETVCQLVISLRDEPVTVREFLAFVLKKRILGYTSVAKAFVNTPGVIGSYAVRYLTAFGESSEREALKERLTTGGTSDLKSLSALISGLDSVRDQRELEKLMSREDIPIELRVLAATRLSPERQKEIVKELRLYLEMTFPASPVFDAKRKGLLQGESRRLASPHLTVELANSISILLALECETHLTRDTVERAALLWINMDQSRAFLTSQLLRVFADERLRGRVPTEWEMISSTTLITLRSSLLKGKLTVEDGELIIEIAGRFPWDVVRRHLEVESYPHHSQRLFSRLKDLKFAKETKAD